MILNSPELLSRLKNIKLLILDVDGVMTDGRVFWLDGHGWDGRFHVKDGYGLKENLDESRSSSRGH